jgi:phage shock protein PspC (stress-responsive transcriptional regulator)
MNKIIKINLAGQAVSIDEQAYDSLSQYMRSLERYFINTESGKEILEDIEARIAELFFATLRSNDFISEIHVQEAITLMGTAQDMGAEDNDESQDSQAYKDPKRKKLFRDKEDAIFGGVCSGIGAYYGLDTIAVRIMFILLVMLAGAPIVAYIILWAIIPAAITAQDRYRMHGDASTISDIANNIREEATNVSSNLRNGASKWSKNIKKNSTLKRGTQTLTNGIVEILTLVAKLFAVFLIIMLVMLCIYFPLVILSSASGTFSGYINGSGFSASLFLDPPVLNWLYCVSLISLCLIPLGIAIYTLLKFVFNWTTSIHLKGFFIAWLLSLVVFIGVSIYAIRDSHLKFRDFIEQMDVDNNEDASENDAEIINGEGGV